MENERSRAQASTEESFRCSRCGLTFPTEGAAERVCPNCGFPCDRDSCMITGASREGF